MTYRADVDGLRALAVLSVLFYHLDWGVSGGFVGVDIFFVISGFLITSIIQSELQQGRFTMSGFMARRIRRIFPAMLLVVCCVMVAGYFLMLPDDYVELSRSVVAQLLLCANVFFLFTTGGYFGGQGDIMPLLHTWSLSVEEQFYLVMPVILMLMHRWAPAWLGRVFLLMMGMSFCASLYGMQFHPHATFYLLPTRAWELGVGAALVLMPGLAATPASRWLRESVACAGFFAMVYAIVAYSDETRFPGSGALLPCIGAAAFIWANRPLTFVGRVMACRPVVWVGLISYSVYLWHWPLIAFGSYLFIDMHAPWVKALLVFLSLLLGYLSWRYVESAFRRQKSAPTHRPHRKAIVSWVAVTAGMTALCVGILTSAGMPGRFSEPVLRLAAGAYDYVPNARVSMSQALAGELLPMGHSTDPAGVPDVLLWGDSHGQAIYRAFDEYCKEAGCSGVAALYPGTMPLLDFEAVIDGGLGDTAPRWNQAIVDHIIALQIPRVVLVAAWNRNLRELEDHATIHEKLKKTVQTLSEAGTEVVVLKQVPDYDFAPPRRLALDFWWRGDTHDVAVEDSVYQRSPQVSLFKDIGEYARIDDAAPFFAEEATGRYRPSGDGQSWYRDRDHLNDTGARLLKPLFASWTGGPALPGVESVSVQ